MGKTEYGIEVLVLGEEDLFPKRGENEKNSSLEFLSMEENAEKDARSKADGYIYIKLPVTIGRTNQ